MNFFTSDLHLWHKNILSFTNRPFDDIEEMNETLISNINNVVGVSDSLYILGDIAMGMDKENTIKDFIRRVKCPDIHLVFGNHDKQDEALMLSLGFRSAKHYNIVPISKKNKFVLSHYPMMSWDGSTHGSYMLHGHIHSEGTTYNVDNLLNNIRRYDVGVDANHCFPVSEEEIIQFFAEAKNFSFQGELDFIS